MGECGTLEVLDCVDVFRKLNALRKGNGLHSTGSKGIDGLRVGSEVELRADEDDRDTWSVVGDFRPPLVLDVLERGGRVDREAAKEYVRLGV